MHRTESDVQIGIWNSICNGLVGINIIIGDTSKTLLFKLNQDRRGEQKCQAKPIF